MKFADRPRRLRTGGVRPLVSGTTLDATGLIAPVFVDATIDERVPIESIPGHERVPVAEAVDHVAEVREAGVEAAITFGILKSKDPKGSRAYAQSGAVQEVVRTITAGTNAYVITGVCLCEYIDHSHCGVLENHAEDGPALTVENGPTLDLLVETATSHAEAGVDMVAPSASMDGMIGAIRMALDDTGHDEIPIMSYAAKYESAFYGPFRDAVDGAPAFSDRRHYQMGPADVREALREVTLDVEQDADVLMAKLNLPYLDITRAIREGYDHPVAAYSVSGEYAIPHAAAGKDWLNLDRVTHESLLSMKRAGADLIITYFAGRVARQLDRGIDSRAERPEPANSSSGLRDTIPRRARPKHTCQTTFS